MTAALVTNNAFIVKMPKRVDRTVVPAIASDLDHHIQLGRKVILDFSQTDFIESKTTDVFLDGIAKATQRSARLSLRGVRPSVKIKLEVGGILDYFRCTTSPK